MKSIVDILEERISAAMREVSGENVPAVVTPAKDPKFGDYQANGVMALAKKLKTNPRELAQKVLAQVDLTDICEKPEIAGPGFINLRLKSDFLSKALIEISADSKNHLGISRVDKPKRIVVDFSGPNIAKQMHVGHLRSTIIGDCICRILEFLGHTVIRQNHIGDWGTNFGMVILGLWHMCMDEKIHDNQLYYETEPVILKDYASNKEKLKKLCQDIRGRHEKDWEEDSYPVRGDGKKYFKPFLEGLDKLETRNKSEIWGKILAAYQYVNLLEESASEDLKVTTRKKINGSWEYLPIPYESLSRHITTMLQNIDDPDNEQEKKAWELVTKISLQHCETLYGQLNVKITDKDFDYRVVRGESFYRRALGPMVKRLVKNRVASKSEDAICVELEGFKNKDGTPLPFMIQKSDGAHLYQTFDLEALRWRVRWLKADKIIYVTDARQNLHFQMLFKAAEKAKWNEPFGKKVELIHVAFGSVLSENGKPLKTREGENVKLKDLLDEAVERAKAVVDEKNPELPQEKKEKIAKAVSIGAVKYADYSNNRTSDYVFSFDKMLAMDGNTAPYMQYAYARIKSIERKGESRDVDIETELADIAELNLTDPAELDLAKQLIRYGEIIESAAADYRPNYLTAYLYELAQKFSGFYTDCPVLQAGPDKRPTRLLLCDLTARTIRHGLSELLGIEVVEQM